MSSSVKTMTVSVLALILLLLMILWLADAFVTKIKPGIEPIAATYQGATFTVSSTTSMRHEEVTASVKAGQSSEISARIMARIQQIPVKAGDWVKAGDVLVELDSRDLMSRTAQAQSQLKSINARLIQARTHWQRIKNLYQKESATHSDLESATADYDSIKSQFDSANQALREAQTGQSFSRILAASSGRVIDRLANPGDMALPGIKLLALYDPASLRIEANIHEKLAHQLKLGQKLEVFFEALQKTTLVEIEEIVPATDPHSRSLLIKAKIADKSNLLPGMFARVRIPSGVVKQLTLPAHYVKQVGQLDVVWVLNQQTPERRFIRLGKTYNDNYIQILSGLSEGEKVIDPSALKKEQ